MSADPFSDIAGHEGAKQILRFAVQRPHHAYLITGGAGLGAHSLAERFVRALAGASVDQVLVAHPDIAVLAREEGEGAKSQISVEAVREVRARVSCRPVMSARVVAYIPEADRLNEAGANALLKCLEEPPADAVFVLVARDEARLPATIRSRVVALNLAPVASKDVDHWLSARGVHDQRAEAVRIAAGHPGRALRWLQDADERVRIAEAGRTTDALLAARSAGEAVAIFDGVARQAEAADDPVTAWQEQLDGLMSALRDRLSDAPQAGLRLGEALVQARRRAGGPVSPRIWLELALVRGWDQRQS